MVEGKHSRERQGATNDGGLMVKMELRTRKHIRRRQDLGKTTNRKEGKHIQKRKI